MPPQVTDHRGRPVDDDPFGEGDGDSLQMLLKSFQQDFVPLIPDEQQQHQHNNNDGPTKKRRIIFTPRVSVSPRKMKRDRKHKNKHKVEPPEDPNVEVGPVIKIGRARKEEEGPRKKAWFFPRSNRRN